MEIVKVVRAGDMARYSGPGNIHSDPASARAAGLDEPIAQGMMTLAYASELMTREHGAEWLGRGNLDVKFVAVVRDGDTVTVRANPDPEGGYALEAVNQRGEVVMVGRARLLPPGPDDGGRRPGA